MTTAMILTTLLTIGSVGGIKWALSMSPVAESGQIGSIILLAGLGGVAISALLWAFFAGFMIGAHP